MIFLFIFLFFLFQFIWGWIPAVASFFSYSPLGWRIGTRSQECAIFQPLSFSAGPFQGSLNTPLQSSLFTECSGAFPDSRFQNWALEVASTYLYDGPSLSSSPTAQSLFSDPWQPLEMHLGLEQTGILVTQNNSNSWAMLGVRLGDFALFLGNSRP